MITGSIWEKVVFGQYLFARPSSGRTCSACSCWPCTPPISWRWSPAHWPAGQQMLLALAAYATYAVNATQFLLKLRAARLRSGKPDPRPKPRRWGSSRERARSAQAGAGPQRSAGPARARPARGVLRADRHRLAAPQDPGRVLPGRRLAHLRASDPVGRRRDDLRRAALRHRDHRESAIWPASPTPTRSSTAWSVGCSSAGPTSSCCSWSAPARPRSSSSTCRAPPRGCRAASRPRCGCSTIRAAASRRPSPRARTPASPALVPELPAEQPNAAPSLLVVGALADVVEDQFCAAVRAARHRAGALPAAAPRDATCRRSARARSFLLAQPFLGEPRAHWKSAARSRLPRRSRSAPKARRLWLQRRRRLLADVDASASRP